MAGLGGGIGRFARKKHQLSQQDAPVATTSSASSYAEDFHHHSGEEERPAETEFDTAATLASMKIIAPAMKNGNAAVEGADTAGNDLYGDRPETPFNSFANDGLVPPATPGGGFSAIDQMFNAMGDDDDDQHDTEGCNDSMEGMFVDTMQASNDGDDTAESNFGQQGLSFGCDNLRGFSSFDDSTPNAGEEVQRSGNVADGTNGAEAESRIQSPNADADTAERVHGGGIGLFAKKRAVASAAAAPTTATSPTDPRECPLPPQPAEDDVDAGTLNSMKELLSVADLSRFDTELVSKNEETTILAMNPPPSEVSVVVPGQHNDHVGVELPTTIPMSGIDDVDDELTSGTTGAEGGDVINHQKIGEATGGNELDPSDQKTSPYFSNSLNNQSAVRTDDDATGTTSKTIDAKSASVQGGGGAMISRNPSSSAQRVSLSPPPGLNTLRPLHNNRNQAARFSPRERNMDTSTDVDDNSIVIPGIPDVVANTVNIEGGGTTSGMTAGDVGLRSISQFDSTKRNSWSCNMMRASAEGRVGPSLPNSQKPLQASTQIATTSAPDRPNIDNCFGRIEKIKFTGGGSNDSTLFKKSRVTIGAPFVNSESMVNKALTSTAITPDHRRHDVRQDSLSTPYSHGVNGRNGDTITPTPHKVSAPAPIPDATILATTPITTDFQSMKVVEEAPSENPRDRPRSETIYSPTPSTNAKSTTPKACNMNPTASNEGFDELLSEFVTYIQEGADIYEKGQSDLLELEVDLSHAFAAVLRYKDEYTTLLTEIECVQATAESIMSEISK